MIKRIWNNLGIIRTGSVSSGELRMRNLGRVRGYTCFLTLNLSCGVGDSCVLVPSDSANMRKDEPETRVPFRESKLTHLFKNHLQVSRITLVWGCTVGMISCLHSLRRRIIGEGTGVEKRKGLLCLTSSSPGYILAFACLHRLISRGHPWNSSESAAVEIPL